MTSPRDSSYTSKYTEDAGITIIIPVQLPHRYTLLLTKSQRSHDAIFSLYSYPTDALVKTEICAIPFY